jgi:hypothetical protein
MAKKLLVQNGANAVILDMNKEEGNAVCSKVDPQNIKTLFVVTDVTSEGNLNITIYKRSPYIYRILGSKFYISFQYLTYRRVSAKGIGRNKEKV